VDRPAPCLAVALPHLVSRGVFRYDPLMSEGNVYGDVELDARGMRALAHPTRLAILQHLQAQGPNTATGLSGPLGVSPSVASWHLRHLAEHGLVEDFPHEGHGRLRWWRAVVGFRFAAVDEDSADAARSLAGLIEQVEGDVVGRWRAEVEPHLDAPWRRLSGRANTTIVVTEGELEQLERAIEQLLSPFVLRKSAPHEDWPADTRTVRILRHTLPGMPDTGL
jgi:DNA-binding transcriptional ArsR family regulator